MALRNPPPVYTPTSFPLFLSAKDQWNTLQYHLHTLPLSDTHASSTHWLSSIDHKILALALVKKRADLELLQTEVLHTKRDSNCDIRLPNYNVGFAVPGSATSPTFQAHAPITTGPGTRTGGTAGGWSNYNGFSLARDDLSVGEHSGRSGQGGADLVNPCSPVSPSFGPRSTQNFSGTVFRRRSSQISDGLISSDAASAGFGGGGVMQSATKDKERRVVFEAAWVEIERNLGEYIGKLVGDDHFGFQKEDLWAELVRLGIEGRMLKERIKTARGGVKD